MDDGDGWEDQIDVDDSDLPSLVLRNPTVPSLRACSQTPRPSQSPILPKPSSPPQPEPAAAPPGHRHRLVHHFIPGPAGALQAKMHRQDAIVARSRTGSEVAEGRGSHQMADWEDADGDFKMNPWLCALEFLGGELGSSAVSSVKSDRSARRVRQVVGIVSSCRPNGLGDLFVTLKDPTGTIGAFIHHKVLEDDRFGSGDLVVGSALILKQVVAFPVRTVTYLNVTLSNVVKLISKDCGPPRRTTMSTFGVRHITPGKQMEAERLFEDRNNSRTWGAENTDNIYAREEEMLSEFGSASRILAARDASVQASLEETIRNVKSKGMMPDNLCRQDLDRSLQHNNSSSAAMICTGLGKGRRFPKVATLGVERSPNEVTNGVHFSKSDSDNREEDSLHGLVSSVRTTAAIAHGLLRAPLTRQGVEKGNVARITHMAHSSKEKGVEGATRSWPCTMENTLPTSSMAVEPAIKLSEPKKQISKNVVAEWTDEQLAELFCDYEDADGMETFGL